MQLPKHLSILNLSVNISIQRQLQCRHTAAKGRNLFLKKKLEPFG